MEQKKTLNYDDKVVEKIAGISINDLPGILEMNGGLMNNIKERVTDNQEMTKGVDVEVGQKQVAVDLDVICEYGKNIPEVFEEASKKISEKVEEMTGLKVVEITMNVSDVMTREEYNQKNNNNKRDDKSSSDRRSSDFDRRDEEYSHH